MLSSFFGSMTTVSKSLQYNGLAIGVGDVLFFEGQATTVEACVHAEQGDRLCLLLYPLNRTAASTAHSSWQRSTADLHCLDLDGSVQVSMPYCWTWSDQQTVMVLHGHGAVR